MNPDRHQRSCAQRFSAVLAAVAIILISGLSSKGAVADTVLWYNGDPGYFGGELLNEVSTEYGLDAVFDDFNVTDPSGWRADRVWAYDDLSITGVTQAYWAVRSGMSPGDAGTLIASGTSPVTQTLLGASELQGFNKYRLEVSGLDFQLAPGTYWLCVVPYVGSEAGSTGMLKSYLDRTLGANAVGTPAGNDGNALALNMFGQVTSFDGDYSLGIAGVVVPEPAGGALVVAGCLVLALMRKRA